jgi:hypothetical protein
MPVNEVGVVCNPEEKSTVSAWETIPLREARERDDTLFCSLCFEDVETDDEDVPDTLTPLMQTYGTTASRGPRGSL